MARHLGENDPYRGMQTGSEAIRSDSLEERGRKTSGSGNAVDGTSALKTDLADAEKVAAKEVDNWSDLDNDAVRDTEENAGKLYSGSGKEEKKVKPVGFKGIAMKGGPFFAILIALLGAGGIMSNVQTFQPFSLVAQFEETYNSMRISANMRSERFFAAQMSKGRTKSPYGIFGKDFSITKKQQQKLKEQGIEYDEDYDGKKALIYIDSDGKKVAVTADNFKEVYSTDSDFFHKYNAGSMTWRGAIANWFGTNTRAFLKNNHLTRDLFEKYEEMKEELDNTEAEATTAEEGTETTETDEDDSTKMSEQEKQKKISQELLEKNIKEEGELKIKTADDGEKVDDNGNGTGKSNTSEGIFDRTMKTKTEIRQRMDSIAGKYGSSANLVCGAFSAFGAINLLVTAHQALQILNITTSMFEVVDKTKAGLGDKAPLMAYSGALNERKTTSNIIVETDGKGLDNTKSVEVIRDRTAMESAGIASMYGGGIADPNDPSVASFNMASNMKKIFGGIGVSMASFKACTIARMAAAAASLALDVACVATLGMGCVAKLFTGIATGVVVSAGVGTLISFLVPTVANAMMRNLITEFGGENFGNALAMGALLYLGSTHRANGGSLSSIKKYKKFALQQQQVVAENAKYERESLNPFDTTSKYTFMGTVLTQMMSFTHANSVMSTLTAGGSVVTSSLIGMTDSAAAYNVAEDLPDDIDDYASTCPYLASIGAIGDSFCSPYVITDVDTMEKDPNDVLEKVADLGGFSSESGENVTIDGNSDLAKYIKYCDNRQSAFGVADQNIVGELAGTGDINTSSSTFNTAANGVIGAIPFVGDAIDIIQAGEQEVYMGYISGESCVAGNEVGVGLAPDWNKAKYYQRFIEDQSLAESMGVIEKSAVTAYLEDYYNKHPLDDSYEGRLARYSGLTKDNVIALLNLIDYAEFVANYDPATRYAFGTPAVESDNEIFFEKENVMSSDGILLGTIVYADVRNRSFAV